MKPHAAEQSWVAEDQRLAWLMKDQMIVIAGHEGGGLSTELAGHPEVNSDPGILRKSKQHLFAAGLGADKLRAWQETLQSIGVAPAKDSLPGVKRDPDDLLSDAHIPAATEVFHFGEFWHGRTVAGIAVSGKVPARCD
jgi:hypothetical protein